MCMERSVISPQPSHTHSRLYKALCWPYPLRHVWQFLFSYQEVILWSQVWPLDWVWTQPGLSGTEPAVELNLHVTHMGITALEDSHLVSPGKNVWDTSHGRHFEEIFLRVGINKIPFQQKELIIQALNRDEGSPDYFKAKSKGMKLRVFHLKSPPIVTNTNRFNT